MLSELLLPAAAVLIPVSAIALTIFESRAITGAAPEARPAPGDPGLDQDAADGGATDGDLCTLPSAPAASAAILAPATHVVRTATAAAAASPTPAASSPWTTSSSAHHAPHH